MGFLDKLSDSIAETGQEIKKMADQSSTKSQYQSDLKKKEKELEALMYQIGFQMVSNEPDILSEKCPDLYARVLSARAEAKELRNNLAMMTYEMICPGCGRKVVGVAPFCTNCGTRLPEVNFNDGSGFDPNESPAAEAPQTDGVCSNCGEPLNAGVAFCTNCGHPVEK